MGNDLYESRIAICKRCPLYKLDPKKGPICNNALYIDPVDKKTTSFIKKKGYIKGCGCKLQYKAKNLDLHCIIGLW